MIRKEINVNKPITESQKSMLKALENHSVKPDEECQELTDEQLKQFRHIATENRENRRKQTVTLRLSPQTLEKAKSLGKGYTTILSRMIENALDDPETVRKNL